MVERRLAPHSDRSSEPTPGFPGSRRPPSSDGRAGEPGEILETEQSIRIDELEQCLRRPWEPLSTAASEPDTAAGESTDDPTPVCRALTMNLIAVTPRADESLLRAGFRRLVAGNPCVAFLLLLDDHCSDLQTRFSTVIDATPDERTVLLEQVTMAINRDDQRRVASLLRPVLIHDLPTVTLWADRLPADPRFLAEINELGDSLVYDSALFDDAAIDIPRLEEMVESSVDLTSLRLKPWRQSLAEAFESVPWPPLTRLRATVTHAGTAGTSAAAIQLRRWLEQRLQASVKLVETTAQRAPSFEPCSVELTFDDVHIVVTHQWPTPSLRTVVTLEDQCLLPFTVSSRPLTRGQLLAQVAGHQAGA